MKISNYSFTHDPYEVHQRILDRVEKDGGRLILEIGCASGYLTKKFKKQGFLVIGVEKDKKSGQESKKYCKKFFLGDIEDIKILNKISEYKYDQIIISDVLEHLINPVGVLMKITKILKPNGQIIISVPNIAFITVRINLLLGRFEYTDFGIMDKTHLKFFTKSTLISLIKNSGLNVVSFEGVANFTQLPLFFRFFFWLNLMPGWRYIEQKIGSWWLEGLSVQFLITCKKIN